MTTISTMTLAVAGTAIMALSLLAWAGMVDVNLAALLNTLLLMLIMSTLAWGSAMGSLKNGVGKK